MFIVSSFPHFAISHISFQLVAAIQMEVAKSLFFSVIFQMLCLLKI